MNGFSAADMSTAASNGHADGYQSGYLDAVKAVQASKDSSAPAFVVDGNPTWRHGTKAYTVTVDGGEMQIMVMDGARVEFIGEGVHIPSTPAAPRIDLATAWAEGYRSGVTDERISESNIGIAGFGAKIEPARANPYMIDARPKGGITDADPAPIPYMPYLSDRADGVKGHYAIARLRPDGTEEVWNLRHGKWAAFSDGVLSESEAINLLKEITMPAPLKRSEGAYEGVLRSLVACVNNPPNYTTGHCENHKRPGGCPMHNLQCGYPQCDRRQATSAEVGA